MQDAKMHREKFLRKELLRKFAAMVVPRVVYTIIRLIHLTCKKEYHFKQETYPQPCVYAFWHGELLMQLYTYKRHKLPEDEKINIMISQHFDGEIIAKTMHLFNFNTIRGSSKRGAARVLLEAIKKIRAGEDIAITPDGPRGPRHSVADGIIILAQKQKVPVVMQNCKPSKYWQLGSWDRFVIPKPFSTLHFYLSEAFFINDLELEEARALIQKRLLEHAV